MKTITNTYMKALELNELEQVIGGIFPDFFTKPVPNPVSPIIPVPQPVDYPKPVAPFEGFLFL